MIIPPVVDATGKLNPDGTTPTPIRKESGIRAGDTVCEGNEFSDLITVEVGGEDAGSGTSSTSAAGSDGVIFVLVGCCSCGTVVGGMDELGIIDRSEFKIDGGGARKIPPVYVSFSFVRIRWVDTDDSVSNSICCKKRTDIG